MDIGAASKSSIELFLESRDFEKRLYKDEMILFGTSRIKVDDLRDEYKALLWIKAYIPHRHWMLNNNLDISKIPDEIEY